MTTDNIIYLLIIACGWLLVQHKQLERVKGENRALRTQLHQLRKERNEQNYSLNKIQMKYIVKNRLTDAICGEFKTYGQAGKWVETYTHEQNEGLSPDAPEYCSPFDFELIEV